ncbi:MAG: isopentenyl-diphosphate Delta-isomerase [Salinibacter sp.]
MSNAVVLVDTADRPQGTAEKLRAHAEGWLHRAFSVFVFDRRGRLLLQRRARDKYHSGGLWSNTCCSHPHAEEPPTAAAQRRLQEEMGFSCPVTPAFRRTYHAPVGNGLVEHELDHVFVGTVRDAPIRANPDEVAAWKWMAPLPLQADVEAHPERYTPWFRLLLDDALAAAPVCTEHGTGGPEPARS